MENKILIGDCRIILPTLEAGSVQTCVTSPPYFGLRDYGVDGQIGLESTPGEYVEQMVGVFREVKRVLRDDGTLWVVIGDSYNSSPPGNKNPMSKSGLNGAQTSVKYRERLEDTQQHQQEGRSLVAGYKPKDLLGIPWMVAFALRADGWYLRSDIIWHKPSPMPESVTDRPTKSHEHIFLLSKNANYYYDADAISEPASGMAGTVRNDQPRAMNATPLLQSNRGGHKQEPMKQGAMGVPDNGRRNKRDVWTVATQPYSEAHFATFPPELIEPCIMAGSRTGDVVLDPFGGSGTTGQVAEALGRKWLLIELNAEYAGLAEDRTSQMGMVF